ncbi:MULTISPECIES: DUF7352 domain-containing protein [unclassified Streptomyces]|uniref:DUF7352 domain-containing protein n=1 Tax=unclassified Streptomyces TaxID=2593676 RepID=UPI0004CBF9B6|nr:MULTISPECIES: hypothetical protein [unclassified Streptomyces]
MSTAAQPEVIHRYEIPVDDQNHRFTIGQGPLYFACRQDGVVEFWACAPTDSIALVREFTVVGTGHPMPVGTWHMGTVIAPGGTLVWHVLECAIPFEEAQREVQVEASGDSAQIGREVGRIVRKTRRRGGLEGDT